MENRKIKQIIIESFEITPEQSISELVENTSIARRTAQRYIDELIKENKLEAIGQGRGRYYKRVYTHEETLTKIAVLKNSEHIGTLQFGQGFYSFIYEKSYENSLEGISTHDNQAPSLYPIFENLVPEHHRRDRLTKNDHELGKILAELDNAHGDFKFVHFHELFKFKSTKETRPSWIENKHKILGTDTYPNLLHVTIDIDDEILDDVSSTEHSNLSGYQHKVDVSFKDGVIRYEKMGADYILKPLNRTLTNYFEREKNDAKEYYPFLALNEHLFMSFAKNELALDVPMSGIIEAKHDDFHYIVKRYDRYQGYAYGQFDMAQMLHLPSDKKYDTTLKEALLTFKNKVSTMKTKEDMLVFQIYSLLIKHADLHAKNIGILEVGKSKFIGTPLYDVISVGVYKGDADDVALPLEKNNRKRAKYNLDDMISIANFLNIPIKKAKALIKKTIETYLDTFPSYIKKTVQFEEKYPLFMQKSRLGKRTFSARLQSLYDEKLIELKKQGVLQELGNVDKYGGSLSRDKQQ